jgi:uncharacterized protein YlxW (UPF0749 family)
MTLSIPCLQDNFQNVALFPVQQDLRSKDERIIDLEEENYKLKKRVQTLENENKDLKTTIASLQQQVQILMERLDTIERNCTCGAAAEPKKN